MLGWSNTFTYKGFSLYFLIDARIGGDVMSLTQADLDSRGVTKETAEARDRGYVEYQGQRFENVKGFYGTQVVVTVFPNTICMMQPISAYANYRSAIRFRSHYWQRQKYLKASTSHW